MFALSMTGACPPAQAGVQAPPLNWGVWRNAGDSVHVEIKPCGASVCGTVVWANAKARADAARGGTRELIGQQLFHEFRIDKTGVWRGRVFAPDVNRTFSGSATPLDGSTLRATGCLLGRVFCKSQTWTRLPG